MINFPTLFFFFLLCCHGLPAQDEVSQPQTYIVHVLPPEKMTESSLEEKETYYKSFLPGEASTSTGGESPMIYMYDKVISGFAARLQRMKLMKCPKRMAL